MTRDRIISAALAAAVAVGVVVLVRDEDLGERPADDGRIHHQREAALVELSDAGRGYAYPTTLVDGGTEHLVTSEAPCVRSKADAGLCWSNDVDGGARFFGFDNRFPREDMHPSSSRCQPVACLVTAGEDAAEDEDVKLERRRRDAGG